LARVDIVIGCTGATHPVLSKEQVQTATRQRRARPLFLIDIAVPRDIEPEVHGLENVYLYDIDALECVVDENLGERRRAAKSADEVIEREVETFDRWRQKQAVAPLIQALRKNFFATGEQELERFRRRLGPLTEGQDQALQEMTRALARKFLDKPTRFLRDAADRGRASDVARLFRDVFELERDGHDATNEADERARKKPRLIEGGRDGG
jgi:glutamyl-tRNA reductase